MSFSSISNNCNYVIVFVLHTMHGPFLSLPLGNSQSFLPNPSSTGCAAHYDYVPLKLQITYWFPPPMAIAFFVAF